MAGKLNYRLIDNYTEDDRLITDLDINIKGDTEEKVELIIDADIITKCINEERDRRRNIDAHTKYDKQFYDKSLIYA